MLLNFFLSGHMFPLDWLPEPWFEIVGWLPFKYLAYFPRCDLFGPDPAGRIVDQSWIRTCVAGSRYHDG